MSPQRYRVGIDCRLAGHRHAGIGRYTAQLVQELIANPGPLDFVCCFSDQDQVAEVLGNQRVGTRQKSGVEVIISTAGHYSFAEQWQLPAQLQAAKLDLLHIPHFNVPWLYRGKLIVTIHDLLWHEYRGAAVTTLPAWQYWPKYLIYRLTVDRAVAAAQRLIVPTRTVAGQVAHYYPQVKEKLQVINEGVDRRFFQPPLGQPSNQPPYLVYLGSLYPHKNVQVILDALPLLPAYQLQIISARNVFTDQVRQLVHQRQLDRRVVFLSQQTDQQVIARLQHATALIQPSLSEGFGLTGLEGMAVGTPVIAADIPVFREVYQQHAQYFPPQHAEALVAAVRAVSAGDRLPRVTAARRFAAGYQWMKMAAQTRQLYLEVLSA